MDFIGYYYDTETGFYYVQSRYYDPIVKRFINADEVSNFAANGDFISYNLFAYCEINPVSREDDCGESWNALIGAVAGGIIGGISAAIMGTNIGAGIVSGMVSGKGANGAKLLEITKTSKEVLKTAVSPKKIAMYTAKMQLVKRM